MTNQLITYRLPIDQSLISLMSLMSSTCYVWCSETLEWRPWRHVYVNAILVWMIIKTQNNKEKWLNYFRSPLPGKIFFSVSRVDLPKEMLYNRCFILVSLGKWCNLIVGVTDLRFVLSLDSKTYGSELNNSQYSEEEFALFSAWFIPLCLITSLPLK